MLQTTILFAVIVFVIVTLILVALLLFIKTKLTPSGTVKININEGSKIVEVTPGGNLLSTLAEQKIFLPSACGAYIPPNNRCERYLTSRKLSTCYLYIFNEIRFL